MLNTKQVRAIMRNHIPGTSELWTNKTRKNCGVERSVKCYAPWETKVLAALIAELEQAVGADNVTLTNGGPALSGLPSITVRCQL